MGNGHSTFVRNKNYDHQAQYPYAYGPRSAYPYQPPTGFIPNYPPNGYPTGPMFPQPQIQPPQGFIPPGNYGQGRFLPPRQLNWLPQDKQPRKGKSRRTQSEQFVPGFQPGATSGGQPQPQPQQESEEDCSQYRSILM